MYNQDEHPYAPKNNHNSSVVPISPDINIKVAPHSIEAEQSVLGGILLVPEKLDEVVKILDASDFYRRDHQLIYENILECAESGVPIDVITLEDFLDKKNKSDLVGGLAYIGILAKNTPSAANIKAYAKIVKQRSLEREIIRITTDGGNSAFDKCDGGDANQLILNLQDKLEKLKEKTSQDNRKSSMFEMLKINLDAIDAAQSGEHNNFIKTGIPSIDKIGADQGLPHEYIVVGGRPSHFKSSLLMQVAMYAAKNGTKTNYFTAELSKPILSMRTLSNASGFEFKRLIKGDVSNDDYTLIGAGIEWLKDIPLFFTEAGDLTVDDIVREIRKGYSQGERLFIIDHVEVIKPKTEYHSKNPNDNTKYISNTLYRLKNELKDVCIVLLSPVRKEVESRADKRPLMADLYGSNALGSDADIVLMCYLDEMYNEESEYKNILEIIPRKNRNYGGINESIFMSKNGKCFRVDELKEY